MSDDCKKANATKEELDLCRCCHSEGSHRSLYTPYYRMGVVEQVVFADVLRECFNIELIEMREASQQVLGTICYTCVQRLEEAVSFRRQILKCEKRFRDVYTGCTKTDPTSDVTIKEEKQDIDDTILFESSFDECTSNGDRLAHDGDDYGEDCNDAASEALHRPEGPLRSILEARLEAPRRTKKGTKYKKKKSCAEITEPVKESTEEVIDTIEGVIKAVQKRFLFKRGVHYTKLDDGFQCMKCPVISKNASSMRSHFRSVHLNMSKYKCPICSEGCETVATFTKHKLEKHDIDDRIKCNACDQTFNSKVQLNKHRNSFHMLGVKIRCEECDYESFSMESLYKHKFKHRTVKEFKCRFCKKAFVRKTTMQLHERIHTGDRRKVCAVCGQAFVQKASLNYHMTKYHPEVAF